MNLKAYAKINLSLDILEKREDNYHEINSVMQQINFYDELTFEKSDKIEVNTQFEDDIILKTINKVKQLFNIEQGIKVDIKKNIPTAAGLAGGSSDAATTLTALNELWNLKLKREDMIKIGADLGSDIPFCIAGGSCFVSGKGEIIERIKLPELNLLIINPGYEISTKQAYEDLDKTEYQKTFSSLKLKSSKNITDITNNLHNDFINIQKQDVKQLIKELKDLGALNASITGKGPTVFAIFNTQEKTKEAYMNLKGKHKFACLCKTINQ